MKSLVKEMRRAKDNFSQTDLARINHKVYVSIEKKLKRSFHSAEILGIMMDTDSRYAVVKVVLWERTIKYIMVNLA